VGLKEGKEERKEVMKSGLCEIVVVLDQSGSMDSIVNDAIGGFNTFLKAQQQLPGEANFSLILFNTTNHYEERYLSAPIKDVKPLDNTTYIPNRGTPLYDAVGTAIDKLGEKLAAMKEEDRPEKVVFVILTDGEENSSTDYAYAKIKEMITHQTDAYKWQFVFLASNMDAKAIGTSLGVHGIQGCQGWQGSAGLRAAYVQTCSAVTSYRAQSGPNAKIDLSAHKGP
jgi:uncharacterized protein YegL